MTIKQGTLDQNKWHPFLKMHAWSTQNNPRLHCPLICNPRLFRHLLCCFLLENSIFEMNTLFIFLPTNLTGKTSCLAGKCFYQQRVECEKRKPFYFYRCMCQSRDMHNMPRGEKHILHKMQRILDTWLQIVSWWVQEPAEVSNGVKAIGLNLSKISLQTNVATCVKALTGAPPSVWAKAANPRNLAFYTTTRIFNQLPDWVENATKS